VYAIDVDSPQQHAAMIEKLLLPFPYLSDADRTAAITPYDLANPTDPRELAYPAVVVVTGAREEAFRVVSRDFADRIPEDELIQRLRRLALPPTIQEPPDVGPAQPGARAMPVRTMLHYFRGARFAAVAMGRRHPAAKDDADLYVVQMDRYLEATRALRARLAGKDG
jgi:hypothetical protein